MKSCYVVMGMNNYAVVNGGPKPQAMPKPQAVFEKKKLAEEWVAKKNSKAVGNVYYVERARRML